MTTSLNIRLNRAYLFDNPSPVVVEIIDSDLKKVRQQMILEDAQVLVPSGGLFVVRAHLPSGNHVEAHAVVNEGETADVVLNLYDSPHETLSYQRYLGELPDNVLKKAVTRSMGTKSSFAASSGKQGFRATGSEHPELAPITTDDLRSLWYRVWRKQEGQWHPAPDLNTSPNVIYDVSIAKIGLVVSPEEVYALEIGGDQMPRRYILFCGSPAQANGLNANAEALIRETRLPNAHNGGFVAKVVTVDTMPETFSHFLFRGDFTSALAMVGDLTAYADSAIHRTPREPLATIFLSYFYAHTDDFDALGERAERLAEDFPELADGAVVYGWQRLRQYHDKDGALQWFGKAVARGMPLYTQGVRLLLDGLTYLSGDDNPEAREIDAAARLYASALDLNQRNTTYYGTHPSRPLGQPQADILSDADQFPMIVFG